MLLFAATIAKGGNNGVADMCRRNDSSSGRWHVRVFIRGEERTAILAYSTLRSEVSLEDYHNLQ